MKLYTSKIPVITQELVRLLTTEGDIDTTAPAEVQLDIESVLKEYVRMDRELTDRAKDFVEQRKLAYGQFQKVKRQMAEERLSEFKATAQSSEENRRKLRLAGPDPDRVTVSEEAKRRANETVSERKTRDEIINKQRSNIENNGHMIEAYRQRAVKMRQTLQRGHRDVQWPPD